MARKGFLKCSQNVNGGVCLCFVIGHELEEVGEMFGLGFCRMSVVYHRQSHALRNGRLLVVGA